MRFGRVLATGSAIVALACAVSSPTSAADNGVAARSHDHHQSHNAAGHSGGPEHQHASRENDEQRAIKRSSVDIAIPSVKLVDEHGGEAELSALPPTVEPVYLNFIFTSCTSVCPVMTQTFSILQDNLGPDREHVRMISITIDPEHDTPARLAAYARQFAAGPQWRFLTGSSPNIEALQRAFGVYTPDKMSHQVASFYRAAHGLTWQRLDGFASPAELAALNRSTK